MVLAVFGCDGYSPTATQPSPTLAGTWEGALLAAPYDEDWSLVQLSLQTVGTTATGTLVSRNGVTHPVAGIAREDRATLTVMDLPQDRRPCYVQLNVTRISLSDIRGTLAGRCPNTLLGTEFRLSRSG